MSQGGKWQEVASALGAADGVAEEAVGLGRLAQLAQLGRNRARHEVLSHRESLELREISDLSRNFTGDTIVEHEEILKARELANSGGEGSLNTVVVEEHILQFGKIEKFVRQEAQIIARQMKILETLCLADAVNPPENSQLANLQLMAVALVANPRADQVTQDARRMAQVLGDCMNLGGNPWLPPPDPSPREILRKFAALKKTMSETIMGF